MEEIRQRVIDGTATQADMLAAAGEIVKIEKSIEASRLEISRIRLLSTGIQMCANYSNIPAYVIKVQEDAIYSLTKEKHDAAWAEIVAEIGKEDELEAHSIKNLGISRVYDLNAVVSVIDEGKRAEVLKKALGIARIKKKHPVFKLSVTLGPFSVKGFFSTKEAMETAIEQAKSVLQQNSIEAIFKREYALYTLGSDSNEGGWIQDYIDGKFTDTFITSLKQYVKSVVDVKAALKI